MNFTFHLCDIHYCIFFGSDRAIEELNDSDLDGRLIMVRKDRNPVTAQTEEPVGGRRLYVNNLSWDVSWQDLKDFFREGGDGKGTFKVLRADVFQVSTPVRHHAC